VLHLSVRTKTDVDVHLTNNKQLNKVLQTVRAFSMTKPSDVAQKPTESRASKTLWSKPLSLKRRGADKSNGDLLLHNRSSQRVQFQHNQTRKLPDR
jgi:hypothetical protein